MSKLQQCEHLTEKKTYLAPKLTRYGKVTELTAGGTGTANENSNGTARKP
jgi:hypothetical protein